MPKVFINFRGRDQAGYAVLIDRELTDLFGDDQIFLSSRSIRPGENFVREIIRNLRLCEVVLVVIGPDWLAHGFASSTSRGTGPVDWVYHEIAEALTAGIRVIPVLVEDAAMPAAADLPPTIAGLSSCQYLRLHHRNIPYDLARIVAEISSLIPTSPIRPRGRREGLGFERFLEFFQISRYQFRFASGMTQRHEATRARADEAFTEFSFSGIVGYCGSDYRGSDYRGSDYRGSDYRGSDYRSWDPDDADFGRMDDIRAIMTALRDARRIAAAERFVSRFVRRFLFPTVGLGGAEAAPMEHALLAAAAADYLAVRPDNVVRVVYFLNYAHAELRAFEDFLAKKGLLASSGPSAAQGG